MSKLPQRQQQNYQSGSPSISDKESNDSHQLLLAHLYNYFRSNGLNDSAEALLRECNNSIPKSANGMFLWAIQIYKLTTPSWMNGGVYYGPYNHLFTRIRILWGANKEC